MPFEPLRFLHAANARLDHPFAEAPSLPQRVAASIVDATVRSFGRLIAAALEERVDFLLLGGNTFIEADRSLPARVALLEGVRRLAMDKIPVYIAPGLLDPIEAWRAIADLPANVVLLDPSRPAGACFKRDSKTAAVLCHGARSPLRRASRTSPRALRGETERRAPFVIGVAGQSIGQESPGPNPRPLEHEQPPQAAGDLQASDLAPTPGSLLHAPVDYLACGGGGSRRTTSDPQMIAHDPGPLQGIGFHEAGCCGATRVDVDADGTVRCEFVPTACVRWERFVIDVSPAAPTADFLGSARALLESVCWEPEEEAGIIEWVLRGDSAGLEPFGDEAERRRLAAELGALGCGPDGGEAVCHRVVFAARRPTDGGPGSDPLCADFSEALAQWRSDVPGLVVDGLAAARGVDDVWRLRLAELAADLSPEPIGGAARRIGARIIGRALEGSRP
jgi:hypothetical protein